MRTYKIRGQIYLQNAIYPLEYELGWPWDMSVGPSDEDIIEAIIGDISIVTRHVDLIEETK